MAPRLTCRIAADLPGFWLAARGARRTTVVRPLCRYVLFTAPGDDHQDIVGQRPPQLQRLLGRCRQPDIEQPTIMRREFREEPDWRIFGASRRTDRLYHRPQRQQRRRAVDRPTPLWVEA